MLRASRVFATTVTAVLVATGLTAVTAGSAQAAGTVSSKYLLNHLSSKGEHAAGYDRSEFTLWADADSDGCDARDEVLIAEATTSGTFPDKLIFPWGEVAVSVAR